MKCLLRESYMLSGQRHSAAFQSHIFQLFLNNVKMQCDIVKFRQDDSILSSLILHLSEAYMYSMESCSLSLFSTRRHFITYDKQPRPQAGILLCLPMACHTSLLKWRSWSHQGSYSTSSPVSTGMGDVSGFDSRRRHFISVCKQTPRSTKPFILSRSIN